MALISDKSRFVVPEFYFPVAHSHMKELKLESATISAQVDGWSKSEIGQTVTKIDPHKNTVSLSNGKEFTYKALVIATGFDHKSEFIEGLSDFEKD